MTKKARNRVLLAATVLVGVAAAIITVPRLLQRSFKAQIAEFLQAPEDAIHVNLPPAAGRYPGCIVAIGDGTLRLVQAGLPTDPDLLRGEEMKVAWQGGDVSSAAGSAAFARVGELIKSSAVSKVDLTIKGARLYEMPDPKLSERAMTNVTSRLKGEALYIVVRAVEGIPVLKLSRGSKTSAEAWAKVREDAKANRDVRVSGDTRSDDELSIELEAPVVIAYEVALARYFSNSLGPTPDSVKIERLSGADLASFEAASKKAGAQ